MNENSGNYIYLSLYPGVPPPGDKPVQLVFSSQLLEDRDDYFLNYTWLYGSLPPSELKTYLANVKPETSEIIFPNPIPLRYLKKINVSSLDPKILEKIPIKYCSPTLDFTKIPEKYYSLFNNPPNKMEQPLSRDLATTIALNLEGEALINFCLADKRTLGHVCNNPSFWWRKLEKDYPYYTAYMQKSGLILKNPKNTYMRFLKEDFEIEEKLGLYLRDYFALNGKTDKEIRQIFRPYFRRIMRFIEKNGFVRSEYIPNYDPPVEFKNVETTEQFRRYYRNVMANYNTILQKRFNLPSF